MKTFVEIVAEPFYLRPLLETDAEEIHAVWTDAYVRQYLFDDEVIPRAQAAEEIEASLVSFEKHRYGLWAAFLQGDPEMIGFTGFRNFYEPPELQLLYGLLQKFTGKGYATHLAEIMIKYAFEELNFDKVIACADVPNEASIRVMQRARMQFQKRVEIAGSDIVYYTLHRQPYRTHLQLKVRLGERSAPIEESIQGSS